MKEGGFFRHTFYDTGDGSCIAFFDLHGAGEKEHWDSAPDHELAKSLLHVTSTHAAEKVHLR